MSDDVYTPLKNGCSNPQTVHPELKTANKLAGEALTSRDKFVQRHGEIFNASRAAHGPRLDGLTTHAEATRAGFDANAAFETERDAEFAANNEKAAALDKAIADSDAVLARTLANMTMPQATPSQASHDPVLLELVRNAAGDMAKLNKLIDDPDVQDAVARAPRLVTSLAPDLYQRVKEAALSRIYPEAYTSLQIDRANLANIKQVRSIFAAQNKSTFGPRAARERIF